MRITSTSFRHEGSIPQECAFARPDPASHITLSANRNPHLAWEGPPRGTKSFALLVVDPDAPSGQFVHWVIAGLDPALGGLEEGEVPETAVEARNDTSEFGWFGPCPPAGEKHNYVFTLFALSEPSGVAAGAGGQDAIDLIATTPGTATILTGTYTGP